MKEKYAIFDMDNTLSTNEGRHHYNWSLVHNDAPVPQMVSLAHSLQKAGYGIIILTARNEGYGHKPKTYDGEDYKSIGRKGTLQWLKDHGITCEILYMKPYNSYQNSAEFKSEAVRGILDCGYYNVELIFDDSEPVVSKLKNDFNIPVLQIHL